MGIKHLVSAGIAVLLAVSATAAPAFAQESVQADTDNQTQRLALARQIIDTSYPEDVRFDLFNDVGQQMNAQAMEAVRTTLFSDAQPGAIEVFEAWQKEVVQEEEAVLRRHIAAIMEAWTQAYASEFTAAELRDILAFVQTPSGLRFMNSQQDVLQNPVFVSANQAYHNDIMTITRDRMPDLNKAFADLGDGQSSSK